MADEPTGTCGCHDRAETAHPELDARQIPPAIRHAAIFGALGGIGLGHGMVLVAPHDPIPLLGQVQERYGDAFDVDYVERGPEAWRVRFVRRA